MATRQQLEPTGALGAPLHVKYRPVSLKEVWGQDEVVKSLSRNLAADAPAHSYLYTGPAGCGKTTLARLTMHQLGIDDANILETDAATHTGIDSIRELTDGLRYRGFGGSSRRGVILDEVHALSKAAWQSLLKILEEPPAHVFFALCTTDLAKVPDTVVSRCLHYQVKPLRRDDMLDFLEDVCRREKLRVPEEVLREVERASFGGLRSALTALQVVSECDDAKEAAQLLSMPFESADFSAVMRKLIDGKLTWDEAREFLKAHKDDDPEGLRLSILNYLAAVCLSANEKRAGPLLDAILQFSKPTNRSEKMAPLLLAFGTLTL